MKRLLLVLCLVMPLIARAAVTDPFQVGPTGATGLTGPTGATGAGVSGLTAGAIPVATSATQLGNSGVFWDATAPTGKQLVIPTYGYNNPAALAALMATYGNTGLTISPGSLALTALDGNDIIQFAFRGSATALTPMVAGQDLGAIPFWDVWDGTGFHHVAFVDAQLYDAANVSIDAAYYVRPFQDATTLSVDLFTGGHSYQTIGRASARVGDGAETSPHAMLIGYNGVDQGTDTIGIGLSAAPEILIVPGTVAVRGTLDLSGATVTGGPIGPTGATGATGPTGATGATGSTGLVCDLVGTPTCGTGCASVTANSGNCIGSLSTSTLATSAVLNFSGTRGLTPFCVCTDNSVASFCAVTAVSTSSVTFGLSAALTGTVSYVCYGGK